MKIFNSTETFEDRIINAIIGIILVFVLIGIIYGAWYIKRSFNAWLYYDTATINQVCEMVKPEYIKDGYCNEVQ